MGESDFQNCHPHLHRLARSLLRVMEVDLHPVGSSVRKLGRKFSAACCALSNYQRRHRGPGVGSWPQSEPDTGLEEEGFFQYCSDRSLGGCLLSSS